MLNDPVLLFFIFGVIAGLVKSDIRMPSAIYEFLSILLLLTIGMKGGVELAEQSLSTLLPQILALLLMGFAIPFVLFPVLKLGGKFGREDAASIAAHYGSVSVGTFAVAIAFLEQNAIDYESHVAVFVVVLEIPAIIAGIFLARGLSSGVSWGQMSHEIFLGKSILLLLGGLAIGWIAGDDGLVRVKPFFFDLFAGVLCLFLLEMGLIVSKQLSSLKKYGFFLIVFGLVTPILLSIIGIKLALIMELSVGGAVVVGALLASASYIAVPAAMRISVPRANPTLSLTASLGVTFPFNVIIGIPFLYYPLAQYLA